MAESQTITVQLLLEIRTKRAGLDARRKRFCIHFEHAPHSSHIKRHHHAPVVASLEAAGDI